jgi:hypothetical protein
MFLMFYKRRQAKNIIDEINRDHQLYNTLSEEYQEIASVAIKRSIILSERIWGVLISVSILSFPILAVLSTSFSFFFAAEPRRYLTHDIVLPLDNPEDRFLTPYYELMNIYMTTSATICIFNFVSYDGLFGVAANHACLKMNIVSQLLEDAFKSQNSKVIFEGVVRFIEEQKRMYR